MARVARHRARGLGLRRDLAVSVGAQSATGQAPVRLQVDADALSASAVAPYVGGRGTVPLAPTTYEYFELRRQHRAEAVAVNGRLVSEAQGHLAEPQTSIRLKSAYPLLRQACDGGMVDAGLLKEPQETSVRVAHSSRPPRQAARRTRRGEGRVRHASGGPPQVTWLGRRRPAVAAPIPSV